MNHIGENILVTIVIVLVLLNLTALFLPAWRSKQHMVTIDPNTGRILDPEVDSDPPHNVEVRKTGTSDNTNVDNAGDTIGEQEIGKIGIRKKKSTTDDRVPSRPSTEGENDQNYNSTTVNKSYSFSVEKSSDYSTTIATKSSNVSVDKTSDKRVKNIANQPENTPGNVSDSNADVSDILGFNSGSNAQSDIPGFNSGDNAENDIPGFNSGDNADVNSGISGFNSGDNISRRPTHDKGVVNATDNTRHINSSELGNSDSNFGNKTDLDCTHINTANNDTKVDYTKTKTVNQKASLESTHTNTVNNKTNLDNNTVNNKTVTTISSETNATKNEPVVCRVTILIKEGLWQHSCSKTFPGEVVCEFDEEAWCDDLAYPTHDNFVISAHVFGDVMLLCAVVSILRARCNKPRYILEMAGFKIGMGGILMMLGVTVYATGDEDEMQYQHIRLLAGWGITVGVAIVSILLCIYCMRRHVKETQPPIRRRYFPINDDDDEHLLCDVV